MYLCQFGHNLAIASEDADKAFSLFYDTGDLGN